MSKYAEQVVLSWRQDNDDDFETRTVWAEITDEGVASFSVGSGLTRADAYVVTMRYYAMPAEMRTLLYNVTQRATLGDFTLASCEVRDRGDLLITSIVESDRRRRELSITCTSRQP